MRGGCLDRGGVSVCWAGGGLSKAPRLSGSGFALARVGGGRALGLGFACVVGVWIGVGGVV